MAFDFETGKICFNCKMVFTVSQYCVRCHSTRITGLSSLLSDKDRQTIKAIKWDGKMVERKRKEYT